MKFFDYMMRYKLVVQGIDGKVARLAHHDILAPVDSNELSDWADWLRRAKGTDDLANGLIKCWWNWRDMLTDNVDKRCPRCGQRAQFHVCDLFRQGERLAEALICPEHGLYFIIATHLENNTTLAGQLDKYAVDAIHNGLVTQLY